MTTLSRWERCRRLSWPWAGARWRSPTRTRSSFPDAGHTKLDLAKYYVAVADGALRGIAGRPIVLKRYVERRRGRAVLPEARARAASRLGRDGGAELSLRPDRARDRRARRRAAPVDRQPRLHRPQPASGARRRSRSSGRAARRSRPRPGRQLGRRAARGADRRATCSASTGCAAGPRRRARAASTSTCASSRRWSFDQVRRAALAVAREVERRAPELATSKWWKEERHGVFLDYNQNAKDRTVASAWSVRPTPDARVSMPLDWDEVADCDPAAFTLVTAPARLAERGDASAAIDAAPGSLDRLLELSAAQEAAGLGDAPWPPHYKKQAGRAATRHAVAPERREHCGALGGLGACKRPATVEPAADHRRQGASSKDDALAGLERWKARHPHAAALLAGRRRARRLDARPLERRGRASGSTCATFPKPTVRRRSRPIPTTIRGATPTRSGAGRGRRRRARARRRASPPADRSGSRAGACRGASARTARRGGSACPACGRRRPRRRARAGAAPSSGPCRGSSGCVAPGHALPRRRRLRLRLGPVAPGMAVERVLAQRRQLGDELLCARRCVNAAVTPTWCSVPSSS